MTANTLCILQALNSGRHPSPRCGVSMCSSKVPLFKRFHKLLSVTSMESRALLWHPKSRLSPSEKKGGGVSLHMNIEFFFFLRNLPLVPTPPPHPTTSPYDAERKRRYCFHISAYSQAISLLSATARYKATVSVVMTCRKIQQR